VECGNPRADSFCDQLIEKVRRDRDLTKLVIALYREAEAKGELAEPIFRPVKHPVSVMKATLGG
jgi:hypothetical protein